MVLGVASSGMCKIAAWDGVVLFGGCCGWFVLVGFLFVWLCVVVVMCVVFVLFFLARCLGKHNGL